MSGHSKWAKLKHTKGVTDAKKSLMFAKLGRMITVAAREAGPDPSSNFKLRLVMEKAKQINMPKDNVDRAIKKGAGGAGEAQIENVMYEAYLPGGAALLIEGLTDNTNRMVSSLRRIFNKYGGSLANQNSVLWMFDRKGILRLSDLSKISDREAFELKLIDLGAEDIKNEDEALAIYASPENLQKIKEALEQDGLNVDYAEVEWFAKNYIKINASDQKKVDAIYAELDEDQDINDYYSNIG
ncbi:MAG: YebC/PmpR family DNA-binding transcriptional regulator [Patescibacteria group bacterium]|nr:YebC/PmpR family DNA-binding transcriptional regulator [Patescibacteria group bacterium]MDD5121193.1 YebC/PmpR family DNA-binding transcriptional regulator [Patescibacteria group bacterium]MDD5222005.1 YebC/PmpR family DNA-binding transcriptional regulator [Patescibacteria group bacterium]MDD5395888.1 YebC/PmpR family DNA-binding transcriptional regulator [Patescibacteria group bacterium]